MGDILKVIFSLIGVVILILLTYYCANWLNKRVKFIGGSVVKVHERINLGTDKAMVIVSVGEKYMLLGITHDNINKISDLDKDDVERSLEEKKAATKQTFAMSLANVIASKMQKKGGGENDES